MSPSKKPTRPSEALALHREEVRAILARHGISEPRIFGSVARNEDDGDSDLDLLVRAPSDVSLWELARCDGELSRTLEFPVMLTVEDHVSTAFRRRIDGDLRPL